MSLLIQFSVALMFAVGAFMAAPVVSDSGAQVIAPVSVSPGSSAAADSLFSSKGGTHAAGGISIGF